MCILMCISMCILICRLYYVDINVYTNEYTNIAGVTRVAGGQWRNGGPRRPRGAVGPPAVGGWGDDYRSSNR